MGAIIAHHGLLLAGISSAPLSFVSRMHFDGSNGSTSFPDVSGKSWTAISGAAISTAQSKFGGASLFLNGSSDFIDTARTSDFVFASGQDFTIEMWVNQTSGQQSGDRTLFSCTLGNGVSMGLQNGKLFCGPNGASYGPIASSAIAAGAWVHVAACRSGSTMRVFHGGALMGSASDTMSYVVGLPNIGAGSLNENSTRSSWFGGYIDDFRVTRSALYTAAFTPPTAVLPDV